MAVSRGATVALGLMVNVVQLLVRVGRGALRKGRGVVEILKVQGEVEIQMGRVMVMRVSTRTDMLWTGSPRGRNELRPYSRRSSTISLVGMPSTPAFSIEKEATQLAKFTAARGLPF